MINKEWLHHAKPHGVEAVEDCKQERERTEKKKRMRDWFDTFTKIAVGFILANAIAWVWCSYALAYLGMAEIAESLSEKAVDAILGTFIVYAAKAVLENVNKHGLNVYPQKSSKPTTEATTTTTTTTTTTNNRDC